MGARQNEPDDFDMTFGYSLYKKPKPIVEQVAILRSVFPHLGSFDKTIESRPFPRYMEGYFAMPEWSLIASSYGGAVERIMAVIASRRPFRNYREGELGPRRLRQGACKDYSLRRLGEEQQGHSILVMPGQFGGRYDGLSAEWARERFAPGEFGWGAFEVAIALLTHTERLVSSEDLWIECAGDEFAPKSDGVFSECPYWRFYEDRLDFLTSDVRLSADGNGTASGCLIGSRPFYPQFVR